MGRSMRWRAIRQHCAGYLAPARPNRRWASARHAYQGASTVTPQSYLTPRKQRSQQVECSLYGGHFLTKDENCRNGRARRAPPRITPHEELGAQLPRHASTPHVPDMELTTDARCPLLELVAPFACTTA
jgi:hypothetical protein